MRGDEGLCPPLFRKLKVPSLLIISGRCAVKDPCPRPDPIHVINEEGRPFRDGLPILVLINQKITR